MEEKLETEPDFQYIPEKAPLDSVHQDDHSLRESMIQLAEGLITGTVLTQFDVSNTVWFLFFFKIFQILIFKERIGKERERNIHPRWIKPAT